jgi:hypothetical protein
MGSLPLDPLSAGGKVEDTVLLRDGEIELLTGPPELPVVSNVWL